MKQNGLLRKITLGHFKTVIGIKEMTLQDLKMLICLTYGNDWLKMEKNVYFLNYLLFD